MEHIAAGKSNYRAHKRKSAKSLAAYYNSLRRRHCCLTLQRVVENDSFALNIYFSLSNYVRPLLASQHNLSA